MDVMRTRFVKRMEKCSVASSEVSGHFARSNSTGLNPRTQVLPENKINNLHLFQCRNGSDYALEIY